MGCNSLRNTQYLHEDLPKFVKEFYEYLRHCLWFNVDTVPTIPSNDSKPDKGKLCPPWGSHNEKKNQIHIEIEMIKSYGAYGSVILTIRQLTKSQTFQKYTEREFNESSLEIRILE